MRLALFLSLFVCFPLVSQANDYYVGPSDSAGNGSSCANADAYNGSYISTASNWVPGITWHLCGTITVPVGGNGITALGSGTASNPINIVFESGAILQSAAFGGRPSALGLIIGGGIVINGYDYIVVDGKNTGTIQNTENGSSLTYQNTTIGVLAEGDYLVVRNLTIQDIYVNSSAESNSTPGFGSTDIEFDGNDGEICSNKLTNAHIGVDFSSGWAGPRTEGPASCNDTVSASGVHVYNNYISDHGWMINVGGGGYANIYDNEMTNWANWFYPTNTTYAYHLDGIIAYGVGSGDVVKPYIYDNYIHGDFVGYPTGFIFCTYGNTGSGSACTIYNNLLVGTGNTATQGQGIYFHSADGNPLGPHYIYNNTIVGFNTGSIYADGDTTQVYTIENNIIWSGGGWYYQFNSTPISNMTSNNNVFYGGRYNGGSDPNGGFSVGSVTDGTLSQWQATGEDSNSVESNPDLSSTYMIQSTSSVAYGIGTNLTSLDLSSLDTGAPASFGTSYSCGAGCVSEPSSGAWDAGAYPYGTSSQPVTELCSVSATSCTVSSSIPSGTGIIVIFSNEETSEPSFTVTDSCGDTYAGQLSVASGVGADGIVMLYTMTTCAMTSGVSAISESTTTVNGFLAYAITPFASGSQGDVTATSVENDTTTFSAGPTSNTTSTDVCFAAANAAASGGLTWSASTPWTLAPDSNVGSDNRVLAAAYQIVSSGEQVTGSMTSTAAGAGEMAVQCLKQ
jgi:hypothetical protein